MDLASATQKVKERAASGMGDLGATVKFVFDEGVIFLNGANAADPVHNNDEDADCTVNVALSDFHQMMDGDLSPMSAFMGGQMKIDGDMSIAMKLSSIFG